MLEFSEQYMLRGACDCREANKLEERLVVGVTLARNQASMSANLVNFMSALSHFQQKVRLQAFCRHITVVHQYS